MNDDDDCMRDPVDWLHFFFFQIKLIIYKGAIIPSPAAAAPAAAEIHPCLLGGRTTIVNVELSDHDNNIVHDENPRPLCDQTTYPPSIAPSILQEDEEEETAHASNLHA